MSQTKSEESESDEADAGRSVAALMIAKKEARAILDDRQYAQCVLLVKRLCEFGDRLATSDLDIRSFGEFWELRLKGGFLRRINLRIYFADYSARRAIIVLKTYKKEERRDEPPRNDYPGRSLRELLCRGIAKRNQRVSQEERLVCNREVSKRGGGHVRNSRTRSSQTRHRVGAKFSSTLGCKKKPCHPALSVHVDNRQRKRTG